MVDADAWRESGNQRGVVAIPLQSLDVASGRPRVDHEWRGGRRVLVVNQADAFLQREATGQGRARHVRGPMLESPATWVRGAFRQRRSACFAYRGSSWRSSVSGWRSRS